MKLGEIAHKVKSAMGVIGEVVDFVGDVVIGSSILSGKTTVNTDNSGASEQTTTKQKIKTHFANIGRGDEAIIAHLLGKLKDKDKATFLGFKIWLTGEDKIKYFILRRHLVFLYEKSEKEAIETILDIVSKLELGGNKKTLEYCNGMEITYDSTIALISKAASLAKKGAVPINKQINQTSHRAATEVIGFMRKRETAIAKRPFWKFW